MEFLLRLRRQCALHDKTMDCVKVFFDGACVASMTEQGRKYMSLPRSSGPIAHQKVVYYKSVPLQRPRQSLKQTITRNPDGRCVFRGTRGRCCAVDCEL